MTRTSFCRFSGGRCASTASYSQSQQQEAAIDLQQTAHKMRWRIDSASNKLKDFRRVATLYGRLVRNYSASVRLVAAPGWWIE
jgi:hypothetical protein